MNEKEEIDTYEHVVEIDKYISMHLIIPKKLSIIELKGLTTKVNKLFNMAAVNMLAEPVEPAQETNQSASVAQEKPPVALGRPKMTVSADRAEVKIYMTRGDYNGLVVFNMKMENDRWYIKSWKY